MNTAENPSMELTLDEFTDEVNYLCEQECERINASRHGLFTAEHLDYPSLMLAHYYDQGLTPAEAMKALKENEDKEGRREQEWEARVS